MGNKCNVFTSEILILETSLPLFPLDIIAIISNYSDFPSEEQIKLFIQKWKMIKKFDVAKFSLSEARILSYNLPKNKNVRFVLGKCEYSYQGIQKLCQLDLHRGQIRDTGVIILTALLQKNTTLLHINLARNRISNIGAEAIAYFLEKNSCLTSLNLENNFITHQGAESIAESITHNSTLERMNLNVAITFDKWRTLITLISSDTQLDDNDGMIIATLIAFNPSLTELDLSRNTLCDISVVQIVNSLRSCILLTSLNLHSNGIGNQSAITISKAMKMNSHLRSLNLHNNRIEDAGARAIGVYLKDNSTLTVLNLGYNRIGDVGLATIGQSLKFNSNLSALLLPKNVIGDAGVTALCEGLKYNSFLKKLDLQQNNIKDNGAVAIAEIIIENTQIKFLYLQSNNISYDTQMKLGSKGVPKSVFCYDPLTLDLRGCINHQKLYQKHINILENINESHF